MFSKGDLRAFASTIVHDLIDAGVEITVPHNRIQTVEETLTRILPNENDSVEMD